MHVKWLEVALDSLIAEAEYISQDSPAAADRTVDAIVSAVENLKRFPSSGRPGRVPGTRELVVSRTPYIVPYRVRGDTLELLLVLHAASKCPAAFETASQSKSGSQFRTNKKLLLTHPTFSCLHS